jgi:hypothetical protein
MKNDEDNKDLIKRFEEKCAAIDVAAILQWAIDSKPIKFPKKKTRSDIEFFKEGDGPEICRMQKLLKEILETDPVTTIEDVIPSSKRHLGRKYFDSIQSRG